MKGYEKHFRPREDGSLDFDAVGALYIISDTIDPDQGADGKLLAHEVMHKVYAEATRKAFTKAQQLETLLERYHVRGKRDDRIFLMLDDLVAVVGQVRVFEIMGLKEGAS